MLCNVRRAGRITMQQNAAIGTQADHDRLHGDGGNGTDRAVAHATQGVRSNVANSTTHKQHVWAVTLAATATMTQLFVVQGWPLVLGRKSGHHV